MAYREIEKYLIPDLRNICCEYLGKTHEEWKGVYNEVVESFKKINTRLNYLNQRKTNYERQVSIFHYIKLLRNLKKGREAPRKKKRGIKHKTYINIFGNRVRCKSKSKRRRGIRKNKPNKSFGLNELRSFGLKDINPPELYTFRPVY